MRAKFVSKEEQRNFFLEVKKSTGMGSRKLSRVLGLKSRGCIENYTSGRTSPTVALVNKLEELIGIRWDYQQVNRTDIKKAYRNRLPIR